MSVTLSDISKCLTGDVIERAFKKKIGKEDNVKSIKITRAAPAGEGLLSAVYRIRVNGYWHSTSFIVKALVHDPILLKSLKCEKYFEREVHFFKNILPVLVKFQKSTGAKESIMDIIPECYECYVDGCNDYIIMEDLAESNFESMPENPTIKQRDLMLRTIAHFHAVSMALRVKRYTEYERLAKTLPEVYLSTENRSWYVPYLQKAIAIDRQVLAEYEDPDSIYFKKFNEVVDSDAYGQLAALVEHCGDNSVWCHGDTWISNFMYSKGRMVAIDFQITRCASPATDLAYNIMICGNLCTNRNHFMNAVDVYYSSLEHYLTDMGINAFQVFSLNNLHEEIKKFGKFGFLGCLTTIPLISEERFDTLESLKEKFPGMEQVPLVDIWKLSLRKEEYKVRLVNMVRVSVDIGLI